MSQSRALALLLRLRRRELDHERQALARLDAAREQTDAASRAVVASLTAEGIQARLGEADALGFGPFLHAGLSRRAELDAEAERLDAAREPQQAIVRERLGELKRLELALEHRAWRERVDSERRAQIALDDLTLARWTMAPA